MKLFWLFFITIVHSYWTFILWLTESVPFSISSCILLKLSILTICILQAEIIEKFILLSESDMFNYT